MKKRAFISFDYDHDEELKQALIGQSKILIPHFLLMICPLNKQLMGIGNITPGKEFGNAMLL